MLQEAIGYLTKNPDALQQFKEGSLNFWNLDAEELRAVVDVASGNINKTTCYWD